MKLKDRVAIVTGAGSGIGQASALLFGQEGARVAVVDLKPDAARATVEQIEKAGGQALAITADVSRAEDNREAVAQTTARWGRLDVFFANAGVPQWPTAVEDMDENSFDKIMAVNVKGVFLGVKFAAPVMKKQKSGIILITGSTAAFKPRPGGQCYAASKGAVTVMGQSLAVELAPLGIRVVVIAPVATETPMLPTFMGKKAIDDEGMQRYTATVPLGRLNRPDDLAKAALFLASDDAAMITGSPFIVDGGRCARTSSRSPPTRSGCARWPRTWSAARRASSSTPARCWRRIASGCRPPTRSGKPCAGPTTASRPMPSGRERSS